MLWENHMLQSYNMHQYYLPLGLPPPVTHKQHWSSHQWILFWLKEVHRTKAQNMRQQCNGGSQRAWRKREIRILRKQSLFQASNLVCWLAGQEARVRKVFCSYFTHLELKEAPFLFHFFCNLCSSDLRADHSMLFCMLSFLLLNFCTAVKTDTT